MSLFERIEPAREQQPQDFLGIEGVAGQNRSS
jgi:hypothetical protein